MIETSPIIDVASMQASNASAYELKNHGMSSVDLDNIMTEIREQPSFRREMDKCVDYYDNNQLDPDTLADLEDKGMGPLITNMVKPTVDVVLGMEAKTRTDWRVATESDEDESVALALSEKIKEAERESHCDRACSDAYAGQIKAGIGWVEISRCMDPWRYKYRAESVHRREIYWDWRAKDYDLYDARYFVRKRWFDLQQAITFFPQHVELLRSVGYGWDAGWMGKAHDNPTLAMAFEQERGWSIDEYEWRDTFRQRICLYEVWYRTYARGYIIWMPDGTPRELDKKNPVHMQAIARGIVKPEMRIYSKLRKSFWCGPHKLGDFDNKSNKLPYIPYWGYREDLTGVPYGLIRSMISPQDEINARRQKMMWLLSVKRLQIDSDALDKNYNTISEVLDEIARADAAIITDPNRRNAKGFSIDENLQLSDQQFKILQESKQALQDSAGVYQAMLGKESAADSGVAINSLVEQGTMTLAEINDNTRHSRRLTGELLLDYIRDGMTGQQVDVLAGESGKRKIISLNIPAVDENTGLPFLKNDVAKVKAKVVLEDVPSTPTYRQQMMRTLGETMQSLPPNLQSVIAPFFIEATELPERRKIADEMRKALGMAEGEEDPEKQQLVQLVEQLQQHIAELEQSPQLEKAKAEATKLAKDAENKAADTDKKKAETMKILGEVDQQRIVTQQTVANPQGYMQQY